MEKIQILKKLELFSTNNNSFDKKNLNFTLNPIQQDVHNRVLNNNITGNDSRYKNKVC